MAHSHRPDIFPNMDSAAVVQSPHDAEASLNRDHGDRSNFPGTGSPISGVNPTKLITRGLECVGDCSYSSECSVCGFNES
jgi:hypothetical protein